MVSPRVFQSLSPSSILGGTALSQNGKLGTWRALQVRCGKTDTLHSPPRVGLQGTNKLCFHYNLVMEAITKTCTKCNMTKDVAEFNKNAGKPDSLQPWCRTCTRARHKELYHEKDRKASVMIANKVSRARNLQYLKDYLINHPCVDCGETDLVVLDFDHVRGIKIRDVTDMAWRGYSIAKLTAEIEKCEVRCSNDHRRATARRRLNACVV